MGTIVSAVIILIILILIGISLKQALNKEKHKVYFEHSREYHNKFKSNSQLQEEYYKSSAGKEFDKLIKKIESDPREMAYVQDSINEEELNKAYKKFALKRANEVAFRYLNLMIKIWPTPRDYRNIPKSAIIGYIRELYPNVKDPESILVELTEAGVLAKWFNKEEYVLLIDRVYHPLERDEKGYRVLLLNNTVFVRPQETF